MKSRSVSKYYYLLALVSPLIAVWYAIKSLSWENRKGILIFCITLFGATIILKTSDGYVLQQLVYYHYVGLSFDQWLYELQQMLLLQPVPPTKGDVYSHVSSYLIGEILGFPSQYFIFVSFVYAYFFVNAISKILKWQNTIEKSYLFWFAIIIFISYRFIDSLQTVRTWTGLWVLFNGVYGYHETKRSKYLILMFTAPLFHFAYFGIAIPAYIVVFAKKLPPIFFIVVYFASFFININPSGIIEQAKTTELGANKVQGYYRENPDEYDDPTQNENNNWYVRYGKNWSSKQAPHILAVSLIVIGGFSRKKMSSLAIGLFSTGILMASMANLGDFIPAFYNRTMGNAGIYIIATVVIMLIKGRLFQNGLISIKIQKNIFWISFIFFTPYIIYVIANIFQFTSFFMVLMPIIGFFPELNFSIRDFISYII
jgi:hypothetical protein